QTLACSILTALLSEFSSSSKTSNIGLSMEFHGSCKRVFQEEDLRQIFVLTVEVLQEFSLRENLSAQMSSVFQRYLALANQVLSWNFLPPNHILSKDRNHICSFSALISVLCRPKPKWSKILLVLVDSRLCDRGFWSPVHSKIREDSDMAQDSLQCLAQLASMHGPVFPDETAQVNYLAHLVEGLLNMINGIEIEDSEAVGISNIISNLITMFPRSNLTALPNDLFTSFVNCLTHLTCSFGRSAALEEVLDKDDMVYMEAYDKLLESWLTLVQDDKHFHKGCFVQPAVQVFNSYIQCHLAAPDGTRNLKLQTANGVASHEEDEINELQEDDRELFSDQLASIGMLGRIAADHCIPLLTSLLEDRVTRLHGQLQRHQQHLLASPGSGSVDRKVLDDLYEDIHWLILVTGYLLADDAQGETPLIPSEVMEFSIKHSSEVDINTTLQVLGSPGEKASSIPGCNRTDSVIRLLSAVLRASEVESRATRANLTELLSPQMGKDIVWFLKRWAKTYLLVDDKLYNQISIPLSTAFGADTEGAQWIVGYLLEKVINNLSVWSSEAELANDTVELLVTLVERRERANIVIQCENWWNLAKQFASRSPPLHFLSSSVQRTLMKALVLGGFAHMDSDTKQQYWTEVLQPLQQRFLNVINQENFQQICQEEEVKQEIIATLEALCGIAEATQIDNVVVLFNFLMDFLNNCIGLMEVYKNTPETVNLIIEVFVEVAHKQICYLGESKSMKLYEACLTLLQVYSKNNLGRKRVDVTAEEDQYQDLLLIMELLTNLLSKEFIDFSDTDEVFRGQEQGQGANRSVSAADVVLYGVNIVLPLMSQDLLKFPSLCNQYYKLITFICEIFPEKIPQLPEDLFKSLMYSLELGMTSMSSEVSQLCLEALTPLAEQCAKSQETDAPLFIATRHFLKLVFDMLVLQKHNTEMTVAAGEALYTLVCLHQAEYSELVESLLSSQQDAVIYQRLADAFNKLTASSTPPTMDRKQKVAFLKSLEEFVANVGGLLCVK
uniref:Exportin-4 n=1 Tax=Lepisosteus oculatus TaxID=7918 RepID=W5MYC9_LEPOC